VKRESRLRASDVDISPDMNLEAIENEIARLEAEED